MLEQVDTDKLIDCYECDGTGKLVLASPPESDNLPPIGEPPANIHITDCEVDYAIHCGDEIYAYVFDPATGEVYAKIYKPMYRGKAMSLQNTRDIVRRMGFKLRGEIC